MKCKICQKETKKIFKAMILNKYTIDYFHCPNCGFLQTQEPFWLDEAYKDPINISDTGYLSRNIYLSKKLTVLLGLFFDCSLPQAPAFRLGKRHAPEPRAERGAEGHLACSHCFAMIESMNEIR